MTTLARDLRSIIKDICNRAGFWVARTKHLPYGVSMSVDCARLLGPDINVIFDIGANIGNWSIQMARTFPRARVFSFEPVPETFQKLQERILKHPRILAFNIAAGDAKNVLPMSLMPSSGQNTLQSSRIDAINVVNVSVEKIDDFCTTNGIEQIDLLKIDN